MANKNKYSGDGHNYVKVDRFQADTFMLKKRYENPIEVCTLFT